MKSKISMLVLIIAGLGLAYSPANWIEAAEGVERRCLRVGVYDSRAIAVAYAHSEYWNQILKGKMKDMEEAKAAGDEEKVLTLRNWGSEHQKQAHLMGFGTAPVHELFEPVKEKLPGVARQAGVDLIVSKWEMDYLSPDAETVDITDSLVQLYNPGEKVLKIVESLHTWEPFSEEVIESHPH